MHRFSPHGPGPGAGWARAISSVSFSRAIGDCITRRAEALKTCLSISDAHSDLGLPAHGREVRADEGVVAIGEVHDLDDAFDGVREALGGVEITQHVPVLAADVGLVDIDGRAIRAESCAGLGAFQCRWDTDSANPIHVSKPLPLHVPRHGGVSVSVADADGIGMLRHQPEHGARCVLRELRAVFRRDADDAALGPAVGPFRREGAGGKTPLRFPPLVPDTAQIEILGRPAVVAPGPGIDAQRGPILGEQIDAIDVGNRDQIVDGLVEPCHDERCRGAEVQFESSFAALLLFRDQCRIGRLRDDVLTVTRGDAGAGSGIERTRCDLLCESGGGWARRMSVAGAQFCSHEAKIACIGKTVPRHEIGIRLFAIIGIPFGAESVRQKELIEHPHLPLRKCPMIVTRLTIDRVLRGIQRSGQRRRYHQQR